MNATLRRTVDLAETVERIERVLARNAELPDPAECRRIREASGLSTRAMAELVETTNASISRWENGLRVPRAAARQRYADVLAILAERLD